MKEVGENNGVLPKWSRTLIEFSDFSEFRESDKLLIGLNLKFLGSSPFNDKYFITHFITSFCGHFSGHHQRMVPCLTDCCGFDE